MLRGARVWKHFYEKKWVQISGKAELAVLIRRHCERISRAEVGRRLYQSALQKFNCVVELTNPYVK